MIKGEKTLILGIGNPILGDDGVGFHVAQELAKRDIGIDIDVEYASTSGLDLLEIIAGYDKVVMIDAIKTRNGEPGEIYRLRPEDFVGTVHATSLHDTNLATAIKVGKELIAGQMPKGIVIFAIEVEEVMEFTEEMTEKVKEAVPRVVDLVLKEIGINYGNE
jgi:hydrogenase maturation protease